MNELLNPEALKAHRKQRGWSQDDLVEKSGIGKAQIGRWERGKSLNIRQNSRDKLATAFKVSWTELTAPPEASQNKNPIGRTIKLTASVKPSTRTALEIVQMMYGVNRKTIIELAPLLFLITAQGSLDERRRGIDEINEMIDEVRDKGKKLLPHISEFIDYLGMGTDEGICVEEKSLKEQELFGPFDTSDGYDLDPYVNHLKKLIAELPKGLVEDIDSSTAGRSPHYRLSRSFLMGKTSLDESTVMGQELLAYIESGDISLLELIRQQLDLSEMEYQDWLSQKLDQTKSEDDKRNAHEMELFSKLGYTAFTDEIRKENIRHSNVKMEDEL